MIEFKGECGHTIRARDEDAGKVVRCSYCGREALVTQEAHDELDALFDEVEETGVYDPQATKVGQRAHRSTQRGKTPAAARKRAAPGFDPFAVALKMTYVAVIIIAAVVAWKYGKGLYDSWSAQRGTTTPTAAGTPSPAESGPRPGASTSDKRYGLLTDRLPRGHFGAYVSSVPRGAMIFHLSEHGVVDSILTNPAAEKHMRTNTDVRIPQPGAQTFAVALQIANQDLMDLPGYKGLRKQLSSPEYGYDKDKAAVQYFVPDGSVATRVESIRGRRYLVRYYEVVTEKNHWTAVTAMFLPRDAGLTELIEHHLPRRENYGFDEAYITQELDFHDISPAQQTVIMDFLRRVGRVCYQKEGGWYHSFQIEVSDGYLKWDELGR